MYGRSKNFLYDSETKIVRIIDPKYKNLLDSGFDFEKELGFSLEESYRYITKTSTARKNSNAMIYELDFSLLEQQYNLAVENFKKKVKDKIKSIKRKIEGRNWQETFEGSRYRKHDISNKNAVTLPFLDRIDSKKTPLLEVVFRRALKHVAQNPINKVMFKQIYDNKEGAYLNAGDFDTDLTMFDYFLENFNIDMLTPEQMIRLASLYAETHKKVLYDQSFDTNGEFEKLLRSATHVLHSFRKGKWATSFGVRQMFAGVFAQEFTRSYKRFRTHGSFQIGRGEVITDLEKMNRLSFEDLSPKLYSLIHTRGKKYKEVEYTEDFMKNKLILFFNREIFEIDPKNDFNYFADLFENYIKYEKTETTPYVIMYKKFLKEVGDVFQVGEYAFDYLLHGETNTSLVGSAKRNWDISKKHITLLPNRSNFDINTINYFLNWSKIFKYIEEKVPNLRELNMQELYDACYEKLFDDNDRVLLKRGKDDEYLSQYFGDFFK